MSQSLNIGITGLLAAQRQIGTVTHNISNANTEGYSRQRVEQETRPPQAYGNGFQGKGTEIRTVRRLADDFINRQLASTLSGEARHAGYAAYAAQVESLVASTDSGVAPALSGFFSALQDVNNDPTSVAAREVLVGATQDLALRFNEAGQRLTDIDRGLNREIANRVAEINDLSREIARLNDEIVKARAVAQDRPANDLLDKRDQAVRDIAQLVDVRTLEEADGSINVMVGKGLVLVGGPTAYPVSAVQNPTDPGRIELAYGTGGGQSIVSESVTRGRLAGLFAAREEVIDGTRNLLGRLAVSVTESVNAAHRNGMDLAGRLGTDLFSVQGPLVNADSGNSGAITVTLDPAQVSGLTGNDYSIRYDGSDYRVTNLTSGVETTFTGAGPFTLDGMVISVTAPPAAGDRYLVSPTRLGATSMTALVTDPSRIAVAAPVRSLAGATNAGSASVTAPEVLDVTDPNLQTGVDLVFADATNYRVNGVGPLIPYTPGANIDINGWRVQIAGTPVAGDTFRVENNAGGTGDNRNGLAMSDLQQTDILDGATTSYEEAYADIVGTVGARTQRANVSLASQTSLRENAEAAREEVSGVNLDEEAANLLKFQQAYQAAAQVIQTSNQLFESLIQVVRR